MYRKDESVKLHLIKKRNRIKIKNSSIFPLERNETGGEQIHDNILRFYCIRYLRQFSIILSRTPIRFAVRKYFSPANGALSPSRNTVLSLIFALSIHRAGPCVSHNGEGAGKGRADTRLSSLKHGSARVNGGTWKSSLYQAYNRAD